MSGQAKPPLEDRLTFAPLILLEYEHSPGQFCLTLFDGEMEKVEEVFHAWNAEGNGHGWEGLAASIVKSQMPEFTNQLDFTSEAGTFAVNSRDLGLLRRLGAILHQAFRDRTLLSDLIRDADPVFLPK